MSVERQIARQEESQYKDRLQSNQKLLLAGPGSLLGLALRGKRVGPFAEMKKILDEELLGNLLREYNAIHSLLVNLVGQGKLVVIKTVITVGKSQDTGIQWESIPLPKDSDFSSADTPALNAFYCSWPRDAHTLLGDEVFATAQAWSLKEDNIRVSPLGEGGKVLTNGTSVLVTPDVWQSAKKEIAELRQKGFKIGCLPSVFPFKQTYDLHEGHIDGHASLIEGKNGQLHLVVADSYSRQGGGTRKKILQAAETVGAEMVEVDDRALPPLALNLIQFEDCSIAVTGSAARDLEVTLAMLVGGDKVFTTEIPIQNIPKVASGSLRCLTNIVPNDFLV